MTEQRAASFSPDRLYRYVLEIRWSDDPVFTVIGLNPSTADETKDDPTIRRCKAFARDCGCGALRMLNLFALRSTDYRGLFKAADPVGEQNSPLTVSARAIQDGKHVVAAWGQHADRKWRFRYRPQEVAELIPGLECLRQLSSGHPEHPLYLPKDLRPVPFSYERIAAHSRSGSEAR